MTPQGNNFTVASGDSIPNYGRAKVTSTDEHGNSIQLQGNITEVHKPLASAGEVSTRMDAYVCEEGGILIRRDSPLGKKIKAMVMKALLEDKLGVQKDTIKMFKENGVYNFYIKASDVKVEQVNAVVQQLNGSASSASGDPNLGPPRA